MHYTLRPLYQTWSHSCIILLQQRFLWKQFFSTFVWHELVGVMHDYAT